jgi:ABC-2 type transport system permease protein
MYFKLIGIALKSMTQFRANFLIGIGGIIFYHTFNLLTIGVILGRFHDLAGWTTWEIVFMYGLWTAGNCIYSLLFLHIQQLEHYIIDGTFDRFLLRPISPFLQLVGTEIDLNGAPDLLTGLGCLYLSMTHLRLHFGLGQWLFLLAALVAGALVSTGITWALSSAAFWTNRSKALVNIAMQFNWRMTQQYPLEMFGKGFRVLVTAFIPVAFLNYYPARWLLGKTGPGDPWYFLSFLSPVVALVLLGIAAFVWKQGLRHYNSTGS